MPKGAIQNGSVFNSSSPPPGIAFTTVIRMLLPLRVFIEMANTQFVARCVFHGQQGAGDHGDGTLPNLRLFHYEQGTLNHYHAFSLSLLMSLHEFQGNTLLPW